MTGPDLLDPGVFLKHLQDSRLLSAEQLEVLQKLGAKGGDARVLGRAAVELGLLTRFQAERILNGKTAGLILGQYRILAELGRGGMGRVYSAIHERMGRKVALKVLSPQLMKSEKAQNLFEREVRAISRLSHPNIVTAFDSNIHEGRHFLVLELIEGPTLSQFLRKHGPMSVDQALEYTRQVALGLDHAHKRGLVHRDIKPGNLLIQLEEAGGNKVPGPIKISDFGLARLRDTDPDKMSESSINASTHSITGTPDYISPEQARDIHLADIRSDLYSLGCTLFQCLTDKVPFDGSNVIEKLVRHASEAPPDPRVKRPEVPAEISLLLQKLMAKLPDQRFPSPAALVAEIERIQSALDMDSSGQWVNAEAVYINADYSPAEDSANEGKLSISREPPSRDTFRAISDSTIGPQSNPIVTLIKTTPKSDSKKVGIAIAIGVASFLTLLFFVYLFGPGSASTSKSKSDTPASSKK